MACSLEKVVHYITKTSSLAKNYLLSQPFYVSLDITNRCNLRCKGCDFPRRFEEKKVGRDPSFKEIQEAVGLLYAAFGSTILALAGFEPTIRKDLSKIIKAISLHHYVAITTNGTLINRPAAKDYWGAGMSLAFVSIPSFDCQRFKEIVGVDSYCLQDIKQGIEALIETAPKFSTVTIAATIDNKTTPSEMEQVIIYAKGIGAFVSFQPYTSSKLAFVDNDYKVEEDERAITISTLNSVFQGSLSKIVKDLKRKYFPTVIGRDIALNNFDFYIKNGFILFKPRILKGYTNGDLALFPEGEIFSNIYSSSNIRQDYQNHAENLRRKGPLQANNCYRCVNMTNPSTPIGDLLGKIWRYLS